MIRPTPRPSLLPYTTLLRSPDTLLENRIQSIFIPQSCNAVTRTQTAKLFHFLKEQSNPGLQYFIKFTSTLCVSHISCSFLARCKLRPVETKNTEINKLT